jgi:type VI secretion system protein ImpG
MPNIYYEKEIQKLSAAFEGYTKQYPKKASDLHLTEQHDRDPSVERLIEGFAYIAGEIHRRIDDDFPEITHSLLHSIAPELLQPIPSAVIVQFFPQTAYLQKTIHIDKGTEVTSIPIEINKNLINFRFSTQETIKLNPLEIYSAKIEKNNHGKQQLKLNFKVTTHINLNSFDLQNITIHLQSRLEVAQSLYWAVCTAEKINIFINESENSISSTTHLKAEPACHFDSIFTHIKYFFACPEMLNSIKIVGLEKIIFPKNCQSFDITFELTPPISELFLSLNISNETIPVDIFKLHCALAFNLYETSAEPIQLTHTQFEHPLIIDTNQRETVKLFSIKKVSSRINKSGNIKLYTPFENFSNKHNNYYQTIYRENSVGEKMVYMSFSDEITTEPEIISCQLEITNGSLPRQHVTEGDISLLFSNLKNAVKLKNINRPSLYYQMPDHRHSLISTLSLNSFHLNSISNYENLKNLLFQLNWTHTEGSNKKIDSIQKIAIASLNKIKNGAIYTGIEVNVELQEQFFLSHASIFAFSEILHQLFSVFVQINTLVETVIHCQPSGKKISFQHSIGKREPL